jgi:hypothetical protein
MSTGAIRNLALSLILTSLIGLLALGGCGTVGTKVCNLNSSCCGPHQRRLRRPAISICQWTEGTNLCLPHRQWRRRSQFIRLSLGAGQFARHGSPR